MIRLFQLRISSAMRSGFVQCLTFFVFLRSVLTSAAVRFFCESFRAHSRQYPETQSSRRPLCRKDFSIIVAVCPHWYLIST